MLVIVLVENPDADACALAALGVVAARLVDDAGQLASRGHISEPVSAQCVGVRHRVAAVDGIDEIGREQHPVRAAPKQGRKLLGSLAPRAGDAEYIEEIGIGVAPPYIEVMPLGIVV